MSRMKFERVRRGLSQARLAAASEVAQPAVSLIESGRLKPTPHQAERIARVLDIAVTELQSNVETR